MVLRLVLPLALLLLPLNLFAGEPDRTQAQKALAVLKTHCYRCHGDSGAVEGGLNYILEPERLIARRKVVPGKAAESAVFKRVAAGTMPPADVKTRPDAQELALLKSWIDAGAPGSEPSKAPSFITHSQVNESILADLEKMDRRSRRFIRYLSLVNLANAGATDGELQTWRNALSKLINSLSWHPQVRNPQAIDASGTILRIDLRWYMWDANIWNRILQDYPYGLLDDTATGRAIMVSTATRVPTIRADWFVATASRPLLYQEILQLPNNLGELERLLRVDAAINITQERVMRVAFNGSGISRNNRILERHDAVHGYYWRTYDFDEVPQNLVERGVLAPDRRNVFAYPLGPGNIDTLFQHAGGEAIFSLPNGLQAYFVMNAVNNRIDKAPTAIVSDPRRPDKAVETGISCMGCHIPGILVKADQLREHLDKNPKILARNEMEIAKALYPVKETSMARMEEDSKKFQAALALTGTKLTKAEPILTMTLRYEGDLDLPLAAAEVDLSPDEFQKRLGASELLGRNLGALRVAGGTVARQVWVQAFADLAKELRLGVLLQGNVTGGTLPDNTGEVDPLESQGGQANHMVFSADGRRALIAGADRSLQLYDVEARRILKRGVGHTASVWSVALSPDGTKALTGSMDTSVRLWDAVEGREVKRFEGHLSVVTAVAFSPDGTKAASGGFDGAIIVRDLTTDKEVWRLDGPAKYIHSLNFSADGTKLLIAADRAVRLVDAGTGKEVATFSGHTAAVTNAIFSLDGKQVFSASDDRTIRILNAVDLKELRQMPVQDLPVRSLAIQEGSKWLLTGGADQTVRLFEIATGKELGVFRKHADSLVHVSFVNNGRQTISGSRDGKVELWNIEKFSPVSVATPPPVTAIPTISLKPLATIPVDGTVSRLILSPDRKSVYFHDLSNNRLGQIEAATGKLLNSLKLPDEMETITLSGNGKWVYAAGAVGGVGRIAKIDTTTLKVANFFFNVDGVPYDIVAADDGKIYATTDNDIIIFDPTTETTKHIKANWPKWFVSLSPDQKTLFVSSAKNEPGRLVSLSKWNETPVISGLNGTAENALGGQPLSDGKRLFFPSGVVHNPAETTLEKAQSIEKFITGAIDVEGGVLWTVTEKNWLRRYSLTDLKETGGWKLPIQVVRLAVDSKGGKLYLSVIDPQAIRERPRAKGYGDIRIVEIATIAAK